MVSKARRRGEKLPCASDTARDASDGCRDYVSRLVAGRNRTSGKLKSVLFCSPAMAHLHKLEQPGVGIIWQCWNCGWESLPLNLEEGQDMPDHKCPPCPACKGTGRISAASVTTGPCPDCQGTGTKRA